MPTNCFAVKQLSQFYKHSNSADLLRKSLHFHVQAAPKSKILSCKPERFLNFLTLASCFYIKTKNLEERSALISYLKENGVLAVFHYIPLHGAPAGQKYGEFIGEDKYTTRESERLVRLPMYYNLSEEDITYVAELISRFYAR